MKLVKLWPEIGHIEPWNHLHTFFIGGVLWSFGVAVNSFPFTQAPIERSHAAQVLLPLRRNDHLIARQSHLEGDAPLAPKRCCDGTHDEYWTIVEPLRDHGCYQVHDEMISTNPSTLPPAHGSVTLLHLQEMPNSLPTRAWPPTDLMETSVNCFWMVVYSGWYWVLNKCL